MLTVLTLMSKVVLSPLWLLWQLYNGLWWAFEDDPTPPPSPGAIPANTPDAKVKNANPAQARAFEVVDSSPAKPKPRPRPLSALRGGFFGSLGVSVSLAWLAGAMVSSHWMDPARASGTWLISSAFVFVASLWAVRTAVRREVAKSQAPRGFIRRNVGGDAWRARAARAHSFTRSAYVNSAAARAACTTGLRRGVSSLCSNLSKLEAKLGVPKTSAAAPPPNSGPAAHA